MLLSTSNSRIGKILIRTRINFVARSLLLCLFLLVLYQAMILSSWITPSDGINLAQINEIKAQRYAYGKNSDIKMVLVGSSITAKIQADDIGDEVSNIAMRGGSTQTGLEIVKQKQSKPPILLVEINETIARELDPEVIGSLYNPFLSFLRINLPMFKQEYRPVSVLLYGLTRLVKWKRESREKIFVNSPLREKLIKRKEQEWNSPLSDEQREIIIKEAGKIKKQLSEIAKNRVRVVLFDLPREAHLENTVMKKQVRELMKELFPSDSFEWLPNPDSSWETTDGVHLKIADAKAYAVYLKEKLLKPVS